MATLREEDEKLRENIKLRLIELREKYGHNKSDLSKNLDIDRQNFQAWEKQSANRGMTIYSISRVCKSFNITLQEFFNSPLFK